MTDLASILRDGEDPSMPALRAWLLTLAGSVTAAALGIRPYTTRAVLFADKGQANGTLAIVYNDPTGANNKVYHADSAVADGWVIDTAYAEGLSAFVQPLVTLARNYANGIVDVDIPGGQPGERSAQFWSAKAATQIATITMDGALEDPRKFKATSGWDSFLRTNDGYLVHGVRQASVLPPYADPNAPMLPKLKLVMQAHSMGAEGVGDVIAAKLAQLLGKPVPSVNQGHSGFTGAAVALLANATVLRYKPIGGIIPAGTAEIELTPSVSGPCEAFGGVSAAVLGILAGVFGRFRWDSAAQKMYFRRYRAGRVVEVDQPVRFESPLLHFPTEYTFGNAFEDGAARNIVQTAPDTRECILGLWPFRNSVQNPTINVNRFIRSCIDTTDRLVAMQRSRRAAWFILPELAFTGGEDPLNIAKMNAWRVEAARRYGANYIDIPETITRRDTLHPSIGGLGSGSGQEQIANIVAPALLDRGIVISEFN